jgi:hypothetical protein
MVDGITMEAKSQDKAILNEAGHPSARSDRNLILAAMKKTLRSDTASAIARPGNLFGDIRSSIPGSYVYQITAAIESMLIPSDRSTYRLETGT